jgi:hypothetical protein
MERRRKWKLRMQTLKTKDGGTGGHMIGYSQDVWGDEQQRKRRGVCRIGLLNPTGLTV